MDSIELPELGKTLARFDQIGDGLGDMGPQSFRNPERPSKKGVISFDATARLVLVLALNYLRQLCS